MTPPLTGYEQHGGWTTLEEEEDFLTQVADETDALLTVAAISRTGKTVWRIDLGNPTGAPVLIVGLHHGDEPAPREAILAYLRDITYNPTPAQATYLAHRRIVFVPTLNPSGLPDRRRGDDDSIDINADHIRLTRPESQGLAQILADVQPHLVLDMHEYEYVNNPVGPDHLGNRRGASTNVMMRPLEDHLVDQLNASLTVAGFTHGVYGDPSPSTLRYVSPPWHTIGILSEPHRRLPVADRVTISRTIIDAMVTWHESNAVALATAVAASRDYATRPGLPISLPTSPVNSTPREIRRDGWRLLGTIPDKYAPFGIEVDDTGFVSARQPARAFAAMLLDPESPFRVVDTIPMEMTPPVPVPRSPLIGIRHMTDDGVRTVIAAKFHDGERVRDIDLFR